MSEWPMQAQEASEKGKGLVVPADLARELYEALKMSGGEAVQHFRRELSLKPFDEMPPVAKQVEAALARYDQEIGE